MSQLLFEHVKEELPKLRNDLEEVLLLANYELKKIGDGRASPAECKASLSQLDLDYFQVCKAAADGHYKCDYFNSNTDDEFNLKSTSTIRRIRTVVQYMNTECAANGHKYQVHTLEDPKSSLRELQVPKFLAENRLHLTPISPQKMDRNAALGWVRRVVVRTRGRELVGNFNPLLVGGLSWEQCSNWQPLAAEYLEVMSQVCTKFLDILLKDKYPKDVIARLRVSLVQDALKNRYDGTLQELERIVEDTKSYPIKLQSLLHQDDQ